MRLLLQLVIASGVVAPLVVPAAFYLDEILDEQRDHLEHVTAECSPSHPMEAQASSAYKSSRASEALLVALGAARRIGRVDWAWPLIFAMVPSTRLLSRAAFSRARHMRVRHSRTSLPQCAIEYCSSSHGGSMSVCTRGLYSTRPRGLHASSTTG